MREWERERELTSGQKCKINQSRMQKLTAIHAQCCENICHGCHGWWLVYRSLYAEQVLVRCMQTAIAILPQSEVIWLVSGATGQQAGVVDLPDCLLLAIPVEQAINSSCREEKHVKHTSLAMHILPNTVERYCIRGQHSPVAVGKITLWQIAASLICLENSR